MSRIIVTLALLALALAPLAAASSHTPPLPPHQFYGDITINGDPAPTGVTITARVAGNIYGSGIVQNAGQYGYQDIFYVEAGDGQSFDGQSIAFYVNDVLATTYTPYEHGHSTELDISATIEGFGDEDETASTGGSSGGGGGGSASTLSTNEESDEGNSVNITGVNPADQPGPAPADNGTVLSLSGACTPDWVCSEWTQCVNGFQNRRCVDANGCGTEQGMPSETRTCSLENETDTGNFLTGAVIGGGAITWGGLLGALAILAVAAGAGGVGAAFDAAMEGLVWLARNGFRVSAAGRGAGPPPVRQGLRTGPAARGASCPKSGMGQIRGGSRIIFPTGCFDGLAGRLRAADAGCGSCSTDAPAVHRRPPAALQQPDRSNGAAAGPAAGAARPARPVRGAIALAG